MSNAYVKVCGLCEEIKEKYCEFGNDDVVIGIAQRIIDTVKAARDSTINYALLNVAHQLARGKGPVNLTREDARLFRDLLEKQIYEQRNTSTEEGG